jgi:hypothetical protein
MSNALAAAARGLRSAECKRLAPRDTESRIRAGRAQHPGSSRAPHSAADARHVSGLLVAGLRQVRWLPWRHDRCPVNLTAALASFDEVYSPRIVARMDAYDIRVDTLRASTWWHVHDDTDEFFLASTAGSMSRSAALTAARQPSRCSRVTVRRAERDRPQALVTGWLDTDIRAVGHIRHR